MNELYVSKDFTWKKVSFTTQLKAYNLFDEYYRSVLGRRMPGRNYMLLLLIRYQR
jgi:outer membrane receptor protein involved in Fe transport